MTKRAAAVAIRAANLRHPPHQQALLDLLDMYSREPGIAGRPLAPDVRERLIGDLQQQPGGRYFLAFQEDQAIGLAICFLGYSTFAAQPLLNIHDLAVHPTFRGCGVGRALLEAIEGEARRLGCCRLSLEVRADNHAARRLYQRCGFDPGDPVSDAMSYWCKPLES